MIGLIPVQIIEGATHFFGKVDMLPHMFGIDLDAFFLSGIQNAQLFLHFFPPAMIVLQFTIAIVGFEILIRILRMVPVLGKFFS